MKKLGKKEVARKKVEDFDQDGLSLSSHLFVLVF